MNQTENNLMSVFTENNLMSMFTETENYLNGSQSVKSSIGGGIDVVNNYPWSITVSPAARQLVPYIDVKFYQQTKGQLTEAINRLGNFSNNVGSNDVNAFKSIVSSSAISGDDTTYKDMYLADLVGSARFPYFSDEFVDLQHSFQDAFSDKGKSTGSSGRRRGPLEKKFDQYTKIFKHAGNIAAQSVKSVLPGLKLEKTKAWVDTTPTSTSFSFSIFNTIGKDPDIYKNIKLVNTLIYLNSIQKFGPGLTIPPVLVSYTIPGIKYSPVAQMALSITSEGQLTHMPGLGNVPDSYNITITFSDLLLRSRNLHTPLGPRTSVNVFTEDSDNVTNVVVNTLTTLPNLVPTGSSGAGVTGGGTGGGSSGGF